MSKLILSYNGQVISLGNIPIYFDPDTIPIPPPEPIVITTLAVSQIEGYSALGGGNITSGGPSTIRGICWSTSSNPTVADASTQSPSTGEGLYSLMMLSLDESTNYYVRAWAYNADYFEYGDNVQFSTPKVYTACTIYQPFFPNIYEETGFLNCDDVSLTSGTLGEYVIDWRNESPAGEIVFITGSSFEADPSVQQVHPLENEIVFGAELYPVIRSIYIDSSKYSAYNISGALYSPDLQSCLDPVNVIPVNCDSSIESNRTYPVNYSYNNLDDDAILKSRTIKYDLCSSGNEHVEYVAWTFLPELVPEQLKIYYCTSTNYAGTLIDNFICGAQIYGLPQAPVYYPENYPDGSAKTITGSSESTSSIRYVTNLSQIPYNEGDYLRIEVIGGVITPEISETNWRLRLKSFYSNEIDCSFFDASVGKRDLSVDPSIRYSEADCGYVITYKRLTPSRMFNWSDSYINFIEPQPWASYPFLTKYTSMDYSGATSFNVTDLSTKITLRRNTAIIYSGAYSRTSVCTSCKDNGSVTYNLESINDISTFSMQFTSASDYDSFKTIVTVNIPNSPHYADTISAPDSSIGYYSYLRYRIMDSSSCGDDESSDDVFFWLRTDISWNDSQKIIYIPCTIPTISSYIFDTSTAACNDTYYNANLNITRFNNTAAGKTYSGASLPFSYPATFNIIGTEPFYASRHYSVTYNENVVSGMPRYNIEDSLLNSVCDLSTKGWIYNPENYTSTRKWNLYVAFDIVTLTDPEDPINNWKLERMKFLRTGNREDYEYELEWEVSLGQVIYP